MTLSRVDSNGSREPHGASRPVPNGAAGVSASALPNPAESTPSRPRRRTLLEGRDTTTTTTTTTNDRTARRSSLISRTEAPVPAIPPRFLNPNQDSTPSPRLHKAHNSASSLYNRDDGAPKGEPASSPLAFDFNFSRSSSNASPPLRALSHRRLPSSAPRNAVNRSSTNFSSPLARSRSPRPPPPAAANNTSFHTRAAASLPTTEFTFTTTRPNPSEDQTTLRALTGQNVGMGQTEPEANEDLFLQLAEDTNSTDSEPTLTQGASSRTSWHDKRQQPPSSGSNTSGENGRPRTTNYLSGRPSSRFSTHIDTNRANSGYRTPGPATATNFTSPRYDQTTPNNAQLRRTANFSNGLDCSPRSFARNDRSRSPEKSPELPTFGRRRPSFGYPSASSHIRHSSHSAKPQGSDGDSPADSSEAKQSAAESDSVDSQTAPSTVWDELDDLKSRIKKLELTGKIPSTSSAAVMGGGSSSERPRTATTAPTTINSSPKQERKAEQDAHSGAQNPKSPTHATLTLADIHPTLHTALSKAKALLSASLYRTLEATAMDALQLVAMTGSAGPQGTTFSAASIINGVTVSDRHIRRKADMMCRNLTDLCLALCEGKHEAPSIMSSPIAMETPPKPSGPKQKYSRSSLAFGEDLSKIGSGSRPLSRLEARRSSILGLQPSNGALNSLHASGDYISASEQETTPSQPHRALEARRQSRLSNRLSAPRFDRYEDPAGDEDYRPPSRAVTEYGSFRSPLQQQSPREYNSPASKQPHRSPSLRESLNARRANATAMDNNREVPRVASLNMDASRRRFARDSTPPVLEEEASEIAAAAQQRRRLTSFGHYVSSRRAVDLATRSTSLSHRRPNNVMVE